MPILLTSDPPPEVARYFDQKGLKPSFNWRDVWGQEHAHAFTVAKATKLDVLQTIRDSVSKALHDGTPFEAWKKDLEPELKRLGWWGKKVMTDPLTGDPVIARLGSPRRLKTIYWANTRTARAAGAWERAQRTKRMLPYLVYRLGPSENHRPHHESKLGTVLPVDDPFWHEWYPPNGWNCKCWVRQISRSEAEEFGGVSEPPEIPRQTYTNERTGESIDIPEGIDPGWHTNPGRARAKTLIDHLNLRIENAGSPAIARSVIADLWRSNAPKAYAAMNERGHLPVAHVPAIAERLDAKSSLVVVSSDTVAVKTGKHSHVTIDTFGLAQDALEDGIAIDRGEKGISYWLRRDSAWWVIVVKKSGAGFLYVPTAFRSSTDRFNDLIKKHGRWN